MTLPASDAFSLGLAHDQRRRSISRTRTPSIPRRSSSPKISFTSPSPSLPSTPAPAGSATPFSPPLTSAMGAKRGHKRKASSRQETQHSGESTIEELVEEVDARIAARERKLEAAGSLSSKKHVRNGSASSATTTTPNGTILDKHDKAAKKAVDWEIPRKALHSSIGFFTIYLYTSHGSPRHVVVALSTALAVLIPIDILRLRYPSFERAFEKCVGMFMRDSEKKSSNGVIWYILGVNAVLSTLPLDIAVVSVLVLSWADTAASTFGRLYGRLTPPLPQRLFGVLPLAPRKSLAGFIAASVTGAAVATGFWALIGPMRDSGLTWSWEGGVSPAFSGGGSSSTAFSGWVGIVTIGIVAGLVSGVAEALDLGSVDDNLTLPIITGGCLWGLFKVLGWLGGVFA